MSFILSIIIRKVKHSGFQLVCLSVMISYLNIKIKILKYDFQAECI